MTPRFNPDVNGYWMCDIGRFDYHWIEGDERLRRPLVRDAAALAAGRLARGAGDGCAIGVGRGRRTPAALRFLISAHASHRRAVPARPPRAARSACRQDGVAISWRTTREAAAAEPKFKVPPVDAPNVRGAARPRFPGQREADRRRRSVGASAQTVEAGARRSALRLRSRARRLDRRSCRG